MQNPFSSTVAHSSDKRGDPEVETTRGEVNSHTEERSIASEDNINPSTRSSSEGIMS